MPKFMRAFGVEDWEEAWSWVRRVWRMAWPIVLSNMTVPLVGAVDTAVAGHLDDVALIGAVALGSLVFSYIYWGFGFLRMGTTGLVAQALGAEDEGEIRAVLHRAFLLSLLIGALCVLLAGPASTLAFTLLGGSDTVESGARIYFEIRVWGAPAALCNIAALGWLWGMQAARASLVQQIVINGANVILNLIFVFHLGWGLEGIAWASVAAQYLGLAVALLAVRQVLSNRAAPTTVSRLLDWGRLKAMMLINADIFVRTVCLLTGTAFFMNTGAKLGDTVLAANAILMVFQTTSAYGMDGFAHAAEALVGQAIGSGSRRALRAPVAISSLMAGLLSLAVALIFAITGPGIIALLTDIETVREVTGAYLIWAILLPPISVWAYQADGIFIGATRSAEMRNAMIVSLALFWLLGSWFADAYGNHGIWLAYTIFMAARSLSLAFYYPRLERRLSD